MVFNLYINTHIAHNSTYIWARVTEASLSGPVTLSHGATFATAGKRQGGQVRISRDIPV